MYKWKKLSTLSPEELRKLCVECFWELPINISETGFIYVCDDNSLCIHNRYSDKKFYVTLWDSGNFEICVVDPDVNFTIHRSHGWDRGVLNIDFEEFVEKVNE